VLTACICLAGQSLPSVATAANVCEGGGLRHPVVGMGIGGTGAPQSSGMGGTGNRADNGLGGTGAVATGRGGIGGTGTMAGNGSGIGGTGDVATGGSGLGGTGDVAAGGNGMGGTGIVGTITGFGSICVNGVEIHYDSKTPTSIGDQPADAKGLAIGQVVSVNAQGVGQEVHARAIQVLYAVAGPVTRVDAANGRMQVLGQPVQMPPGPRPAAGFRPGDFVQVSGLRRADGVIMASRIQPTRPGLASVTGPVTAVAPGRISIYGADIITASTKTPAGLSAGRVVHVTGRVGPAGQVLADRVVLRPDIPFGGHVTHLSIEGYVHNSGNRQLMNIGGAQVEISAGTRFASGRADELKDDVRVRISGRVGPDQRIHAERIEFEHERPEPAAASPAATHEAHRDHDHSAEHAHREHTERPEVPAPPEHDAEKPERPERIDTVEHPESVERPEQVERPEAAERPETPERPESPERPEEVERPET
jgi:hypothetical protein